MAHQVPKIRIHDVTPDELIIKLYNSVPYLFSCCGKDEMVSFANFQRMTFNLTQLWKHVLPFINGVYASACKQNFVWIYDREVRALNRLIIMDIPCSEFVKMVTTGYLHACLSRCLHIIDPRVQDFHKFAHDPEFNCELK